MIIFIHLILCLAKVESFFKGKCTFIDSSGKERWFCCYNHENVSGTCTECLDGFESLDGSPCRVCPSGFFGKACLKRCDCNKNECNHITGCINIRANQTEETKVSSENISHINDIPESTTLPEVTSMLTTYTDHDVTSILTTYTDSKFTTPWSPTIKLSTFIGKDSTVMISKTRLASSTNSPKAKDMGLNDREIIIYSISAGTLIFVILICSVCQRRYRMIYGNLKRYQTHNRRRINITDNSLPDIPLDDIDGIYEVIDESNMIIDLENLMDNNISDSDTTGSYVQAESNGYLTPYQPADEDKNVDNSKDKSKYSVSSDDVNLTISNSESTSSSSEEDRIRSSYLNPYQPIIPSTDIHEYSCIHNSSSVSVTLTRELGYFNPNQLFPDTDLHDKIHENKSVQGCSKRSSSSNSLANTCTTELEFTSPYLDKDLPSELYTQENIPVGGILCDTVSMDVDMTTDGSLEKIRIHTEEN